MEERNLTEEIEQAETLLDLLQAIDQAYKNLPQIDLSDDIGQAETLLDLLKTARKEA